MPEFHVGNHVFTSFERAAAHALDRAVSRGEIILDVVISSEEDAHAFGGDDAVERYLEDPDASVFERIVVKAHSMGRVA